MAQRHSIVTVAGRNKEAAKLAANEKFVLTHIALGSDGAFPSGGETELQNEVHRGQITGSGVEVGQNNVVWFDLYVPANVNTFLARQIALFDEDGVLYAISRYAEVVPKFGPDSSSSADITFRMIVVFSDTENVLVKLNPIAGLTAGNLVQHLPWATSEEAGDKETSNKVMQVSDAHSLFALHRDETIAGDNTEASPLTIRAASLTKSGISRLATKAETEKGESDKLAVTPAGLAHMLALTRVSITLPNTYEYNLAADLTSRGYDLGADLDIVATLPTGGILGGSAAKPAFDTGTGFTDKSKIKLVIEPGAHIIGDSGGGANGEMSGIGNGGPGGPALKAQTEITIDNLGTIAGGGGGGARVGCAGCNWLGSSGAGSVSGGGLGAGIHTSNPANFKVPYQLGGATGYWDKKGTGAGGGADGGEWGQPGGAAGSGTVGGAGGAAIEAGNDKTTWINEGTRAGAINA